jgi:pimeloyl-ACP methyl ester carboxylesterase
MTRGLIHFLHGKGSNPAGVKIVALVEVARRRGWDTAAMDYSHTDDPSARLRQLLDACTGVPRPLLLVGSSMGGWVAAEAAATLQPAGLFLLAPALGLDRYPTREPQVAADTTEIVHGWDDEVIPCENAVRFARLRNCMLHLIQGEHTLNGQVPLLCELFDAWLARFERSGDAMR